MLRTLELGLTSAGGKGDNVLLKISRLLAHRQYMQYLSASLQKVISISLSSSSSLQAMWIDYPLELPKSRIALVGGLSFIVDMLVEDTQVSVAYTKYASPSAAGVSSTCALSLSRVEDIERYLEKVCSSS